MKSSVRSFLVVLAVADLARAKRFYDAAFGWEVAAEVPVYVEYRLAEGLGVGLYARGGFALSAGAEPMALPAGAISGAELYVRVDDLDAAVRRLEAAGARALSPAAPRLWGDVAAYFADPDGNVVAVAREGDEEA